MKDVDASRVYPFREGRAVVRYVPAFRNADRSTGAQRHKDVAQESVVGRSGELTDARVGACAKHAGLPRDEVCDALETTRNSFRRARRTGSEKDRAQIVGIGFEPR